MKVYKSIQKKFDGLIPLYSKHDNVAVFYEYWFNSSYLYWNTEIRNYFQIWFPMIGADCFLPTDVILLKERPKQPNQWDAD